MKLLLFGSLLVVLGVAAWAAMDWAIDSVVAPASRAEPVAPDFRFVNVGRERDGTQRATAIVWQTSTAPEDCAYLIDRRKQDEKQRIADLVSSAGVRLDREDANPCAAFQLGKVEDGTEVEILGECGSMARIRILAGDLRGRSGCIETAELGVARD